MNDNDKGLETILRKISNLNDILEEAKKISKENNISNWKQVKKHNC